MPALELAPRQEGADGDHAAQLHQFVIAPHGPEEGDAVELPPDDRDADHDRDRHEDDAAHIGQPAREALDGAARRGLGPWCDGVIFRGVLRVPEPCSARVSR
jgi:hypothetical protein